MFFLRMCVLLMKLNGLKLVVRNIVNVYKKILILFKNRTMFIKATYKHFVRDDTKQKCGLAMLILLRYKVNDISNYTKNNGPMEYVL